jgi:hypothetical protein
VLGPGVPQTVEDCSLFAGILPQNASFCTGYGNVCRQ